MSEDVPKAATVIALRDSQHGLEALFVQRAASMAFYGGAWVFPGGRVDPGDFRPEGALEDAARNAGARELCEEAGVEVAPETLVYVSRWLTPPGKSRRYDTFYFATRAPGSEVRVDRAEIDAYQWLTPSAALHARVSGEIELPPPTFVTLCVLERFVSVEDALRGLALAHKSFVPKLCPVPGGIVHLYEGDAGYAAGDPALEGPRHRLVTSGSEWRYEG